MRGGDESRARVLHASCLLVGIRRERAEEEIQSYDPSCFAQSRLSGPSTPRRFPPASLSRDQRIRPWGCAGSTCLPCSRRRRRRGGGRDGDALLRHVLVLIGEVEDRPCRTRAAGSGSACEKTWLSMGGSRYIIENSNVAQPPVPQVDLPELAVELVRARVLRVVRARRGRRSRQGCWPLYGPCSQGYVISARGRRAPRLFCAPRPGS